MVFWQFLNPEAHSKSKPAITDSRYCWELPELPRTWQFLGPYTQIDREGLQHASFHSAAYKIVQRWCLLLTDAGRQTLFVPNMIPEDFVVCCWNRGDLQLQQRNPPEKAPGTVKLEKNSWALSLLWLLKNEKPVGGMPQLAVCRVCSERGGSFNCLQTLS